MAIRTHIYRVKPRIFAIARKSQYCLSPDSNTRPQGITPFELPVRDQKCSNLQTSVKDLPNSLSACFLTDTSTLFYRIYTSAASFVSRSNISAYKVIRPVIVPFKELKRIKQPADWCTKMFGFQLKIWEMFHAHFIGVYKINK